MSPSKVAARGHGQLVRLLVFGLCIAVALVILLYPTDEKRVRRAAEALLDGVNRGGPALVEAAREHAANDVIVSVSEGGLEVRGREELIVAAERARMMDGRRRVRMDAVDITVEGNRARVNAELVADLEQATIEPRHASALFEKRGGRFQLVSAEVGAPRRDEPEARP